MGPLLAKKWKGRQIRLIDLEQREVGFCVLPHQACFHDAALPDRHRTSGVAHGKRQGDANALRALNHVSIGHNVAAGVYNDSRAHRVLTDDEGGLGFILLAERSVSGNKNLHYGWGNPAGKAFQSAIEFNQDAGSLGWFGLARALFLLRGLWRSRRRAAWAKSAAAGQ